MEITEFRVEQPAKVRDAPSVSAQQVGSRQRGDVVRAVAGTDGVPDNWVQLAPYSSADERCTALERQAADRNCRFMMVDASSLGFGVLLKPVAGRPPASPSKAKKTKKKVATCSPDALPPSVTSCPPAEPATPPPNGLALAEPNGLLYYTVAHPLFIRDAPTTEGRIVGQRRKGCVIVD